MRFILTSLCLIFFSTLICLSEPNPSFTFYASVTNKPNGEMFVLKGVESLPITKATITFVNAGTNTSFNYYRPALTLVGEDASYNYTTFVNVTNNQTVTIPMSVGKWFVVRTANTDGAINTKKVDLTVVVE